MLQPYQQRVVEERAQLEERIARLQTFCNDARFYTVERPERDRMTAQLHAMRHYSAILKERIEAFDTQPAQEASAAPAEE